MNAVVIESLVYQLDGKPYESRLLYAPGSGAQPGLIMAPNWMGVGAGAEAIARSCGARLCGVDC